MADNWSASPIALTDAGDWAKWSITISSTDADNFNNDSLNRLTLRMALSGALLRGDYVLVVNDLTVVSAIENATSTNTWVSDNRFAYDFLIGSNAMFKSRAVNFPGASFQLVNVEPWVAGVNTIRLLWYGDSANDNAPEPIEIDFLAVQSGGPAYITTHWNDDGDDDFNAKPVTVPFTRIGYDDHVDPDPIGADANDDPSGPATWILEGSDATSGTAGDSLLEVIKFCPPIAKVRVTGAGSPLSGTVGVDQGGTVDIATLGGNGTATFTVPGGFNNAHFWYGGNDDWTPALVTIDDAARIRCGGWHVGRIGVG